MKKFLIFALSAFSIWACSDDDKEPTVDSSVPLFQNLKVEYNSTQEKTYVSANFNKDNEKGESVRLSGTSFIRFNDEVPEHTGEHPYYYSSAIPELIDVTFELTRKPGEVYTNKVSTGDISFLEIEKQFTEIGIQDGTTFVWVGKSVGEGETVQVRIVTKSGEYEFHTTDTGNIGIEIQLPESASPGSALFYLSRIKSMNLQQDDKGAGGEIQVVYSCEKEITLK